MESSILKRKLPLVLASLLFLLSLWGMARGGVNLALLFVSYRERYVDPLPLLGNPLSPSLWELALFTFTAIATWHIATKVKSLQGMFWRTVIFFVMLSGIVLQYLWYCTAPIYTRLVPYLELKASQAEIGSETLRNVLIGDMSDLMLLLMALPSVIVWFVVLWFGRLITKHHEVVGEWFSSWEFTHYRLQNFFKAQDKEVWPDVALGPQKKTKEIVYQKGRDRSLNNIIVGPIGTGKTSSLILPIINQDLHWMTRFINIYPTISQQEDYHTEDVKGRHLNGITIIEPSNDLCQKAYQLTKAHGIPEEAVFYIDPTNPNTKAINPLRGPVAKVAEAVTMTIEGIGETQEFFFEQSQRNHLKYHIYLLKLHDPEGDPTFSDLINMYHNAQVVHRMHKKLKRTIPSDWREIPDRDERNHWEIVQGVDSWFDMTYQRSERKVGQNIVIEKVQSGEFRGEEKYYDAKAEYVVGLRNILDDISSNILLRRVLFEKSDFDFDKHLEFGGVLLVNSAKGELGQLSNVLGKFILLSIQNAVFRREPNNSPFHHLIVDEFPDFIYESFKEFPAQSRKYKTIVTVATQTLSQLSMKYGDHYMQTLLGTLRHKMVFGDLTPFDAKLFSEQLGEDDIYEESETEQNVSPLQENPVTRTGSNYTKKREARLSPDKLIFQKRFECAVKLVEDNEPIKVRQLTSNFVDKAEFQEAIVKVDDMSSSTWLHYREQHLGDTNLTDQLKDKDIIDMEEEAPQQESVKKEHQDIELPKKEELSKDKKPEEQYRYEDKSLHSRLRIRKTQQEAVPIDMIDEPEEAELPLTSVESKVSVTQISEPLPDEQPTVDESNLKPSSIVTEHSVEEPEQELVAVSATTANANQRNNVEQSDEAVEVEDDWDAGLFSGDENTSIEAVAEDSVSDKQPLPRKDKEDVEVSTVSKEMESVIDELYDELS